MKLYHSSSGFTLIELIIAMAIFGIMSATILSVYIQTTDISRKLQMTRLLTETSREITERIAADVRENGIDIVSSRFDQSTTHTPWMNPSYSIGWEVLAVKNPLWWIKKYVYGRFDITPTGKVFLPCDDIEQKDSKIHCGLYLWSSTDGSDFISLVDSFTPDETQKRVKITHLKFFISWDASTESKVTLLFDISLMDRMGLRRDLAESTRMTIQTTLSERAFRKY
jgi:prepilin-type N-terminal cleavage/methylation domain-containing protein